jgi:hypothetical protein
VPRYIILEHDWPSRHWDFLLECGDVLRAWRLLAEPRAEEPISVEPNFDHRLLYLDYEGPLSGDRGGVIRWDAGIFEWIANDRNFVKVKLSGGKLTGIFQIVQTPEGWRASWTPL